MLRILLSIFLIKPTIELLSPSIVNFSPFELEKGFISINSSPIYEASCASMLKNKKIKEMEWNELKGA